MFASRDADIETMLAARADTGLIVADDSATLEP